MKNEHTRPHDPFDDSACERQRRMGLLTPDGKADNAVVEVFSRIYAGLFYDNLLDSCGSMEAAHAVCRDLMERNESESARHMMLAICMEYDAMHRPLPEPVWWIVGNNSLLTPFIDGFIGHLTELVPESGAV